MFCQQIKILKIYLEIVFKTSEVIMGLSLKCFKSQDFANQMQEYRYVSTLKQLELLMTSNR
ncbi:hypothetical protein M744_14060 (plasmid) [Synechococcus elongatus UTEX 2973]|nr:hypothetical protein M744_14060 [Synechococcus elongatus UTEX 2973]